MGLFGKSKEDKGQDKQIKDIWKWIEALNKNQRILVKNNNVFIDNEKKQRQLNQQLTASINSLVAKDKQHDAKDAEIEGVIKGIKDMAKAIETTEKVTAQDV